MKQNSIIERVKELDHLLEEGDLGHCSRRLMDFCVDHPSAKALLEERVARLRKALLEWESRPDRWASDDPRPALAREAADLVTAIEAEYVAKEMGGLPRVAVAQPDEGVRLVDQAIVKAVGVAKSYPKGGFRFGPIDLEVGLGELVGVVGENGNGKTTLLRILAGELAHDQGEILFPALRMAQPDWYQVKRQIAFIPQRVPRWHGTLEQNLKFAAAAHGVTGSENAEQVDHILSRLGLERYRNFLWGQLSSGYKLRFELAKMLVWRPKLLVLDEPLANLDIKVQQTFLQDLVYLSKSQRFPFGVVLSSQQLHEVESVSDKVVFLSQGQPRFNGPVAELGVSESLFELAGSFGREELGKALEGSGFRISASGTHFTLRAPAGSLASGLLARLAQCGLELTYFRDITQSTRKFFL